MNSPSGARIPGRLADVARLFLRLGFTAFGGPAAHIAMFRHEVVTRRQWLTDQEFLDLLGATSLIPGPNSTEMAIHVGYRQAGWRGLIGAGAAFIVPAMLIVTVLAWAYVRYEMTPEATWLFYGIKPVIIAILVQALWWLGRTAIRDVLTAGVGLGAVVLYFIGVNEIALLLAAGLTVVLLRNVRGAPRGLSGVAIALAAAAPAVITAVPFTLDRLFLVFVKIGSVLYGSGYVLLAFLHADFVERLRWLTDQQLLDAIAIGQFTPGPVFTTATFIGYLLGGLPGALLATAGIFLPAFVFVAASHPLIPRLRRSPWTGALLDGVNVASFALMAGVTWYLGRSAIVDPVTTVVGVASFGLLVRVKINSAWLVLGGALLGLVARALGG